MAKLGGIPPMGRTGFDTTPLSKKEREKMNRRRKRWEDKTPIAPEMESKKYLAQLAREQEARQANQNKDKRNK
jgi:hypothetical protein